MLKNILRKNKIKDSECVNFFLIIKIIIMSTILKFKEFKTILDTGNNSGSYDKK